MNKSSGLVILELLSSITISTLVIATGFTVLMVLIGQLRNGRLRKEEIYSALIYRQEFRKTVVSLDSHRLPLEPRIHKAGVIRYADGSINPVSRRYDTIAPLPECDAFTRFTLEFNKLLTITEIEGRTSGFAAQFKNMGPEKLSGELDTFLGLTPDGILEFSASLNIAAGEVLLTPSLHSMIAAQNEADPLTLMALVPIRETVTIYTDKSGELRYLAHKGETNIENQPLGRSPKQITLSYQDLQGFYQIKADLLFDHSRPFVFEEVTRLQRADQLTILLNL